MKTVKKILLILVIGFSFQPLMANEMSLSFHRQVASKKASKAEKIKVYAQNCFNNEMDLFESRRGRLPTEEEADYIIDSCVNLRF